MSPKEKAIELVDKFDLPIGLMSSERKQCALIAVEEIIQAIDFDWMEVQNLERQHKYWEEVKQEIMNL